MTVHFLPTPAETDNVIRWVTAVLAVTGALLLVLLVIGVALDAVEEWRARRQAEKEAQKRYEESLRLAARSGEVRHFHPLQHGRPWW